MASSNIFSGIRAMLLFIACITIVSHAVGEQIFCGSRLTQVVELMCPNGVNGYKTKRSSISLDEDLSNELMDEEEGFNFGLSFDMLKDMENFAIAKVRRRTHGLVHECCDKPCSTTEVVPYCKK